MVEFKDVTESEIIFKKQLAKREYCVVFLVIIRDKICVMKVVGARSSGLCYRCTLTLPQHRGHGPKLPYEPRDRELNIYICESTAYRRLTQTGVCARGITPQFYGTIENIDPTLCNPHLKAFVKDKYPPTAILLEYIPNMKELDWSNYSEKRMENFIDGMNAIHEALVEHGDIYPRNMMIVEGDPERAIWIDFDRAQTFNRELSDRQKEWIGFEKAILNEMADYMVCGRQFIAVLTC